MTFQINGTSGKYDGIVKDDSVRYGRNVVENNTKYMETPLINDNGTTAPILEFTPSEKNDEKNFQKIERFIDENDAYLKSLPPLEFEYRYLPNFSNSKIDRKALYGVAYETMGAKELSTKDFESRYLLNDKLTAEPIDINKDGKIDVAEYGANIVASDILSKGTEDITKADGTVNARGMNAILEYSQKSRATAATKLYTDIYNKYELGKELNEFNPQ